MRVQFTIVFFSQEHGWNIVYSISSTRLLIPSSICYQILFFIQSNSQERDLRGTDGNVCFSLACQTLYVSIVNVHVENAISRSTLCRCILLLNYLAFTSSCTPEYTHIIHYTVCLLLVTMKLN